MTLYMSIGRDRAGMDPAVEGVSSKEPLAAASTFFSVSRASRCSVDPPFTMAATGMSSNALKALGPQGSTRNGQAATGVNGTLSAAPTAASSVKPTLTTATNKENVKVANKAGAVVATESKVRKYRAKIMIPPFLPISPSFIHTLHSLTL
jgi:hypothetical protein